MSDDEIRDLLDLGAQDVPTPGAGPAGDGAGPGVGRGASQAGHGVGSSDELTAEQLWSAGRRERNRGRAWVGGLGAAAAAASILGIVWAQGFAGGDTGPVTPATQSPSPIVEEDATQTSEPTPDDDATPTGTISIPNALGSSRVVVLSEGGWDPSGELTPLTQDDAVGGHWLPVDTTTEPPQVGDDVNGDRGLTYDGTTWRFRECGIDVRVPGLLENSLLVATGEPVIMPDPDPGAACVTPELMPEEWVDLLTHEPRLSTDGALLVLSGRTGTAPLAPVGLALLGEGVTDPTGGPTRAVTAEDLAAGLTEVPADVAIGDIGVSDHLDLQPGHATTLSVSDGILTLDVGCPAPLRGPAWFSEADPELGTWQLTAALPKEPSCAGPGTSGAAAGDAELWRQMLAQGVFLHHFGDYVILDGKADEAWAGADGS